MKPHTIIGRLTADAEVRNLEGGKTVVHFTVAENSYYKPKDAIEYKQDTTYYECSYWRNPQAAERLTKGSLVEVSGGLGARGYIDALDNVKAAITVNVNTFQVHDRGKSGQQEDNLPGVEDYHE